VILRGIGLTGVGPFGGTLWVGSFDPGLNVLAAPNESGKTTVMRAAARALFDRHTTKAEEIKAMQPAGTEIGPRVVVEFQVQAERYRIEKTFLVGPVSVLKQWRGDGWQRVADGDAADARVHFLLNSSLPGRGATKPEHWGLLGFLWARQGEASDWPKWGDQGVDGRLRAQLVRMEVDPVIERVRERLRESAEAEITARGAIRAGGKWAETQREMESVGGQLEELRRSRSEMETACQRHEQASAAVTQLEKEHAAQLNVAREVASRLAAAERLLIELEGLRAALGVAQSRLKRVTEDLGVHGVRQAELGAVRAELAAAESAAGVQVQRLSTVRATLDQERRMRRLGEARLQEMRKRLDRLRGLLRLRQMDQGVTDLAHRMGRVEVVRATVTGLVRRRAEVPTVTAAVVQDLERLANSIRDLRSRLEAAGLTVELRPDGDAMVTVRDGETEEGLRLNAGGERRVQRPRTMDLELAGWGRMSIRSGAQETVEMAGRLRAAERELKEGLEGLGMPSVETAREAQVLGRELDLEIKAAEQAMASVVGGQGGVEDLGKEWVEATRRRDRLMQSLQPTPDKQAQGMGELEAADAAVSEAETGAVAGLAAMDERVTGFQLEERGLLEGVAKVERQAAELRARARALEVQLTDLVGRYPEGMESALAAAQMGFVQAEARVAAAQAGLPPELDRLPERNRRAAVALQQIEENLRTNRSEQDRFRGVLETLGGQGLYSRETELEERLEEVRKRLESIQASAWAARIGHDLLVRRRAEATRAVLAPLEERLSTAFARLTGRAERRVYLDEQLGVAGVGRNREELHAFELLSQGAREQLLLCLRVAVAGELAAKEPQVLILDDVLVNTDGVRQQRVLDLLMDAARDLQVVVLTCHPERYRGVGRLLTLQERSGDEG